MRVSIQNLTATTADVLAGTALDQLEAGGQLDIFVASTQADGVLTITGPDNEPVAQAVNPPMKATAVVSMQDDVPLSLPVRTGGHYTITYTEVTAATAQIMAIYRKRGVDF